MPISTALQPSARATFAALVDYAGLFPPARLGLGTAVQEYREARRGPYAWILGRFIIPASSLANPIGFDGPYSAIVEPKADAFNEVADFRERGARIEALEIPLEKSLAPFREHLSPDEILDLLGALETDLGVAKLRDLPVYIEVPRVPPWHGALPATMAALARLGLGAKVRCGGLDAAAFPSVEEMAAFIGTAVVARVPFKATAGLHHPVRHIDPNTGFRMHGFLNLLAAAALAPRAGGEILERVIAEEDPAAFAFDDEDFIWRDERIDLNEIARMRQSAFVAYGSCSFAEPVDDLKSLGILPLQ